MINNITEELLNNPQIIKNYLDNGKLPSMSLEQRKIFLNIAELFRTIRAAGKLEEVLGNKPVFKRQLSLFGDL